MPHNNRVSTSGALKMTGIWSNAIGYDPYAADGEAEQKQAAAEEAAAKAERSKGILELARLSNADQGIGERGANFAQNIFWGLKRKGPPKGYEVPPLEDDDHQDDSDDESDDDESERAAPKSVVVDTRGDADRKKKRKKEKKKAKEHRKEKKKRKHKRRRREED